MIAQGSSSSSTALIATSETSLDPGLQKLREQYEDGIKRQYSDFLRETYGWNRPYDGAKQTLPYSDIDSLARVRKVGRTMATKPTILSATSKLVSYVIGKGHTYTCAARQPNLTNKTIKAKQDRNAAAIQLQMDLALEELNWMGHQQESYNRLLRDGEVFRRIWRLRERVDITYIEPDEIGQPTSRQQLVGEIPDTVLALFDRDTPPGDMGIVTAPRDVRRVMGYWLESREQDGKYEFLEGRNVQHIKDGVDRNDPRGIPRFYWAFCHVIGIDEVDSAMRTLFLVQSKHAAIYNYEGSSLLTDVKRIAQKQSLDDHESDNGRIASPGVAHAKGMKIEIPQHKSASRDAVEIIQQEQRLVGGCSDIPEHLISEDANTGNRSSLVAAEGPFDRRVQREQLHLWSFDLPVLWTIVKVAMGWRIADEKAMRLAYKLTLHCPEAHARDWDKTVETEVLQVDKRLKSRRQAQETLGIDADQANQEILSDTIALPLPAAETSNAGGTAESGNWSSRHGQPNRAWKPGDQIKLHG